MDTPNPQRPCHSHSVSSSKDSLLSTPGFNQSNIDMAISSFLSLSDLPVFSSPVSIGCSFDRVLDKVIHNSAAGTSHDEFEQDRFLDRTLQLASLLYNSTKSCIRKRATLQNYVSWPLLPELTTKVFSMLDTKSLIQASACCTMFNKCAMDRECYSHIDLTTAAEHVDNGVVCIMIHRAGKELRSLKLGSISLPARSTSFLPRSCLTPSASLLTRWCLTPLTFNHGFAGGHLRSLHLYHVMMDGESLYPVLSACSNLTDLKIVGLYDGVNHTNRDEIGLLGLLMRKCRLIKHLFIEIYKLGGKCPPMPLEFVDECPNLLSLSLLGFVLTDAEAQKLIECFPQLKYLNMSNSILTKSTFLRDVGLSCKDIPLETIILRDCTYLYEEEVLLFLNCLLAGVFKSIRLIDISTVHGLISSYSRTYELRFPIEELKKQRSEVTIVANFGLPASSSYGMEEEEEEEEIDYNPIIKKRRRLIMNDDDDDDLDSI